MNQQHPCWVTYEENFKVGAHEQAYIHLSSVVSDVFYREKCYVYEYMHIDDGIYSFCVKENCECARQYTDILMFIRKTLIECGWEGDGYLEVFWLPCFILDKYSVGTFIFHVKQGNNGVSWILSFDSLDRFNVELQEKKFEFDNPFYKKSY